MPHAFPIRIYYEDTDAGGIVYYANYLKFAERARTEALREAGFNQSALRDEQSVLIVVAHCSIDYRKPARLDDELTVYTRLHELGKVRMTMHQEIHRKNEVLVQLVVKLACLNADLGKAAPWPDFLDRRIRQYFSD